MKAPSGEWIIMSDLLVPNLPKPLVLIGMMGAGKSTIGRYVAERLGVTFLDVDREIEFAAGGRSKRYSPISGKHIFAMVNAV